MIQHIKFQTRNKLDILLNLDDYKEIIYRENEYIRLIFKDHRETTLAVKKNGYTFTVDHEVTPQTITSVFTELLITP